MAPQLAVLDSSSPLLFTEPIKRIHETPDVSHFLKSLAYKDLGTFMLQLNRAVCPRLKPASKLPQTFPLSTRSDLSKPVQILQNLLTSIESLISQAPPVSEPQRFGNVSFRTWFTLLEGEAEKLLGNGALRDNVKVGGDKALIEVKSYLLGSFGNPQRLDYGTGHELSFIAFLGCLWKLGFFRQEEGDEPIERQIVLNVIEPYLKLVRKLITTYRLEPAGSHGVWGLDDHSFVPYIFGSAQLTQPITRDDESMPTEGSVRGAPKPAAVTNATIVEDERQTNMYFSAIGFINDIKKGPFWEHSPTLFDISGIKDGWGKINKGMIKMYNAEVLSKFPVVQHFPFGSLFSWDTDPDASPLALQNHQVSSPHISSGPSSASPTGAPWATSTRAPPAMVGTTAPWLQQSTRPTPNNQGVSRPTQMPPRTGAGLRANSGANEQKTGRP